jgi:DNA-binding HxlR family transcriptional regulator
MLKHIGRHGDRKVAILFREVPNEDHMCLVIYPETLPTHIHDSIMKTLESEVGQQATNLADALHRNMLPDGRPQLEALHREGMIKKIPTNQVIVTPNAQSTVKLDELNKIIREMETGQQAVDRLKELDASQGMVDPYTKRKAEAEFKRQQQPAPVAQAPANAALDDKSLAVNMLAQAKRMEVEARGLIAEAARMKKDAQRMHPGVKVDMTAPVVVNASQTNSESESPRRGRPPKVKAVNVDAVQ